MEQVLKNVGASKTFSISRNTKKIYETDEIFDTTRGQRHGIYEIPTPTAVSSGKKPEINTEQRMTKTTNNEMHSFADFVANDRNIFAQRRILLQQEKLQKQTVTALIAASNTKKLNTKGLLQEEENATVEEVKSNKEIDVTKWPQCKIYM